MGHAVCAYRHIIDCIVAALSRQEDHIKCTAGQQKNICQVYFRGVSTLFAGNSDLHPIFRL